MTMSNFTDYARFILNIMLICWSRNDTDVDRQSGRWFIGLVQMMTPYERRCMQISEMIISWIATFSF